MSEEEQAAATLAADKTEALWLLAELSDPARPAFAQPPRWPRAGRDTLGETLETAVWVASSAMVAHWIDATTPEATRRTIEAMWRARLARSRALKTRPGTPALFLLPGGGGARVLQVVRLPTGRVACHLSTDASDDVAMSVHVQRLLAAVVLPVLRTFARTEDAATAFDEVEGEGADDGRSPHYFLEVRRSGRGGTGEAETAARVALARGIALDCRRDALVDVPAYRSARTDAAMTLVGAVADYVLFAVAEATRFGHGAPHNQLEAPVVAGEMALAVAARPGCHLVHPDQIDAAVRGGGSGGDEALVLLARWARGPADRVFFPLNGGGHWTLLVFDGAAASAGALYHLDSLDADGRGGSTHASLARFVAAAFAPGLGVQPLGLAGGLADGQRAAECGLYVLALAALLAAAPPGPLLPQGRTTLTRRAVLAHAEGAMGARWSAAGRAATLAEGAAAIRAVLDRALR